MMKNTTITDFAAKYIDDILNIQVETSLSFWSKKDYLNELERDDSIFKIAQTADKKIIGFALVRLLVGNSATSNLSFDSSEILNIAVLNSFQKKVSGK